MQVWRLSKAKHAATALSGEGARLFSGRWNPAGVPMVYTSGSKALAMLEWLVHLDQSLAPPDIVAIAITIPEAIPVDAVELSHLPEDWRRTEHPHLQTLGAEWIESAKAVAMRVPSAVIDGEWNVLLNPMHADFRKLLVGEPQALKLDARLLKKR